MHYVPILSKIFTYKGYNAQLEYEIKYCIAQL